MASDKASSPARLESASSLPNATDYRFSRALAGSPTGLLRVAVPSRAVAHLLLEIPMHRQQYRRGCAGESPTLQPRRWPERQRRAADTTEAVAIRWGTSSSS